MLLIPSYPSELLQNRLDKSKGRSFWCWLRGLAPSLHSWKFCTYLSALLCCRE